jgi:hypothetical protein
MNRTQWVLAVLLVVQLALLGVMALRSGGGEDEESRALLPELEAFSPGRVQIDGNNDESVTLVRGEEGWTLADPAGYPANGEKVDLLLEKLEGVEVRRPVVSSPRYHATFKVAESEYERRLRIWDSADGQPRIDLFLGSSPNVDVSHVRLAGDDRVYEAQGLGSFDLRVEAISWIERKLIDVSFDDVVAVKLRNAHGEFELAREEGSWSLLDPAGREQALDGAKADTWVRSLTTLYLSAPAGPLDDPDRGLADPEATLEIRWRTLADQPEAEAEQESAAPVSVTEERLTVAVGPEIDGEEGKRQASRSGLDFAVILSRFDAEKMTNQKLADLLPDPD